MERHWKPAVLLLAMLAAAFCVRLAASYWWQSRLPDGQRFAFGDSESYWVLAQQIARGLPYEYGEGMHVFRSPGYPLLLAGLFRVVGDDPPVMWARAFGAAFGTLAVALVIALAWQLFGARAAWIAGALTTLYPGAVSLSVFVLSEAPFCPLLVLQLLAWIAAVRAESFGRSLGWATLGGMVAGCATLVRPSWLLFTPGAAVLALLVSADRRRHLRVGGVLLAALVVTMTPWWIRNYRVTGRFVPTTLQVGASLYDGLSPQATGASDMRFVSAFYREQQRADADHDGPLADTFEFRLDRRFRDASLAWVKQEPGKALRLAGVKLIRMWSPWPHAADMQSWIFRLAVLVGYTPLVVLGFWGAVRARRLGWPCLLCVLPAFYLTSLHMVFVSSIRYREPAMLPLIVLAAGVLAGRRNS
jgi:4-amino-4-deoxy-L-arabinose transferase-like glycosyltransferase